jgi:hypothetical protein
MEPTPYRPRVSRETRLLLTAGVLAIAALWLLARLRFQDRPVTPNPVPAVLSQLSIGSSYDDLASEIAALQSRLQSSLIAVEIPAPPASGQPHRRLAALSVAEQLAVVWLPPAGTAAPWAMARVRVRDPASGLALVEVPRQSSVTLSSAWAPQRLAQPRYVVATESTVQGISLRPTFVASLDPRTSPLWPEPVWALPQSADLRTGSFVFTTAAELVGLVIDDGGVPVVVPGATVLAEAQRLLGAPPTQPGTFGLEVRPLTEALAAVTGATEGVIVAWVAPEGPAAGLMVGDVIEAIDGQVVSSLRQWDVHTARLIAGQRSELRVRRRSELRTVALEASRLVSVGHAGSLGLALRERRGTGAEVTRVEEMSAADRSGLTAGDVITRIGETAAPTPGQVARSFASLGDGERVLIAVTRNDAHLVLVLQR